MTITVDEIEEAANSVDLEDIEDFTMNAPDYCRFLLAKVEELEKERASEKRQYEATCVFYLEEQEKNKALQSQVESLTEVARAATILLDVSEPIGSSAEVASYEVRDATLKKWSNL